MINRIGVHRTNNANVVGDAADMRQQFGKVRAAFTKFLEFKRRTDHEQLFCPEVMPVMRWPMRTEAGSSVPVIALRLGLGSINRCVTARLT